MLGIRHKQAGILRVLKKGLMILQVKAVLEEGHHNPLLRQRLQCLPNQRIVPRVGSNDDCLPVRMHRQVPCQAFFDQLLQ